MNVEVTFTCANRHEPIWFSCWACPLCELRDRSITTFGRVIILPDGSEFLFEAQRAPSSSEGK